MRARFIDSQGPAFWRLVPYLLVFVAAGMAGAFGALAIVNLIGMIPRRQWKLRNVEIELGPGFVNVLKGGTRNQKIRAKDITGGTSARTKTGFAFTLQHRQRKQPLTIEVDSEEELADIRQALGVGHGGFGTLQWATHQGGSNARAAWAGRPLALGAALLVLLARWTRFELELDIDLMLRLTATVITLFGLTGTLRSAGTVIMTAEGLRLHTLRGWFSLPYRMLTGIEERKQALLFRIEGPYPPVAVEQASPIIRGISDAERKLLIAQISSAAERARGLGPQKDDVRGRVEMLRRGGDDARSWLQRLDVAGQVLASGSAGYRGQTLQVEDLWAILEDPEAEPDLRVAAARVLKHAQDPRAQTRIDAAVAAIRDEIDHRRIRVAIKDDVEEAARELTLVEQEARYSAYAKR